MKRVLIFVALLASYIFSARADQYIIEEKRPVLGGFAVGVDLLGPIMKAASSWSNMEIYGRLNFKEKFFVIGEVGIGTANRTGSENNNVFSTTSPYWRVGIDYNLNKKMNGNRFFIGARYGFSSFSYDFRNPDMYDYMYAVAHPLNLKGLSGHAQWLELVLGFETKIWSFIRMGWDGRFRFSTYSKFDKMGDPWYVPGFGIYDTSNFGASMHIMFDFGRSMKKSKVKYNPAY